uniref:RNase NYN domain-containing protein n=1 Tax=Timema bartmani TaxID=61472 RepID=A0A7R9ELS5_9NEOP|nr:unnamed protein product [Timema bartmani]
MKLRSGSVLSPENVSRKSRIPTYLQKPSTKSKDYGIKKKKLFASSSSGSSSFDSSSGSEDSEQPGTSNKASSNISSRKENIKSVKGSPSCKNVKPSESLKTKLSKPRKVVCAKTVSKHTSVALNQNKPKSAGVSRLRDQSMASLSDSFDNLDISGPRRLCKTTKVHSKDYKNSRAEAVKPSTSNRSRKIISSPLHRLSYSSDSDDTGVDRTKSQKNTLAKTLAKTSKINTSSQKSATKSSFKSSQLSVNKSNKSKNSSRSLASGHDSIDVEIVKCSTTVKNLVTKTNSGGLVKTIPVIYIDSSSSSDNLEELLSNKHIQAHNKTRSNKDSNQIKYNKKLTTNSNNPDKLPVSNCNSKVSNQIIPIICLDNSLETSKSLVKDKQSKDFDAGLTTCSNSPSSVVFKSQPAEPLSGDKIKNSSSSWESITACKDTNVNNKDIFETECTKNKPTACESKDNKSDTLHKNTTTVDDSFIKPTNTIQAGHTSDVSKSKCNILPMIPPDFMFKPYKPTESSNDKQPVSNTTNSKPRWNAMSHCKGNTWDTAVNEKRKFNRWEFPCKDKSWRSPASKKIKCPSIPYNNAKFANRSSTKQPGYHYPKNGNTAWQNNNYNVNTYHSPWWLQKYSVNRGYVNTNPNTCHGAQYKTFPSNSSGQYGHVWQNNNQLLDNSQKLGEHVRQLNNQLKSSYNQLSKTLNANVANNIDMNNITYSGSISHQFPSSSNMGSSSNGNTSQALHKEPAIPCATFNDGNSGTNVETNTIPARSNSPVNMFGGNIYLPSSQGVKKCGLRPIVIDGSNVAMGHGNGSDFSYRGLQICITYFVKRGHKVMAFLPQHRKCGLSTKNKQILTQMEKEGHLVFTPSRRVDQRLVVPYDDWYKHMST